MMIVMLICNMHNAPEDYFHFLLSSFLAFAWFFVTVESLLR
jgi:hypothetical protein